MATKTYGLQADVGRMGRNVKLLEPCDEVKMELKLVCEVCNEKTFVEVKVKPGVAFEKTFKCRKNNCQEAGSVWKTMNSPENRTYWAIFSVSGNFENQTYEAPIDDIIWKGESHGGEQFFFFTDKNGNWKMDEEEFEEVFGKYEHPDQVPSVQQLFLAVDEII